MMQQYAALQAAYETAYSQMWAASIGPGADGKSDSCRAVDEQCAPGEYSGTLKYRFRYGQKKSYLLSQLTFQQYGSDIHIDRELIPNGAKDGDAIKFTVEVAYGDAKWDDKSGWAVPYLRGYPKATSAILEEQAPEKK